jgi:Rieske 2Fe-2S family protein
MRFSRLPIPNQYNGLTQLTAGLPAEAYFDPQSYERDLQRIWLRNWIYVGRSSSVATPRSFRTFELGDQRILLVRDEAGTLRGFYNTCRHRGAALCREAGGILPSGAIICPYHAWSYSLKGDLQRTSSKRLPEGFDPADYPLYRISVREQGGFMFISLTEAAPSFDTTFEPSLSRLDAWPLKDLIVGHASVKTIHANWKLFWENFNECLHCPGVHPSLSQLVPIYGRGLVMEGDDPNWRQTADDPDPKYKGGLRGGASTWSLDGQLTGIPFSRLSDEDRRRGAVYVINMPSAFIVAHPDYVRVVRVRPLGPELTELDVEYLFSAESLASPQFDLHKIVKFADKVMSEDVEVCELNQRGLRAAPHVSGVLMPEEHIVYKFHQWVASELARA